MKRKISFAARISLFLLSTLLLSGLHASAVAGFDYDHGYALPGTPRDGEELGTVLAHGDFWGNGYQDIVIGVPNAHTSLPGGGEVIVVFGHLGPKGLSSSRVIDHNSGALAGQVETFSSTGAHFGASLAVGDFDGNGYDDLAIGIAGSVTYQKGQVAVIYSRLGAALWTGDPTMVWVFDESDLGGTAESGDQFGLSLAAGDFDGDGYDDLAVGIPYEDDGSIEDAGAVRIVYGTSNGLHPQDSHRLRQGENAIPGHSETNDRFGWSLATGDFNDDGWVDLAVSAPYEDHSDKTNPGSVWLFFSHAKGLEAVSQTASRCRILTQNDLNTDDDRAANNEKFGWTMTTGDVNGDGYADLVVGVPFEDTGGNSAGEVDIFYGGADGFDSMIGFNQVIDQDWGNTGSTVEAEDKFGYSVAVGDVNGDDYDDVAVGVPLERYDGHIDAGVTHVFFGNSSGLVSNSYVPCEDLAPVGSPEEDDRWGSGVLLADTDGDGLDDLFVGVPGEDYLSSITDMGTVHRIPADGSPDGLNHACSVTLRKVLDYKKDYTSFDEMETLLFDLESESNAKFNDVFLLEEIGQSYEGRPIYAVKISDDPEIDDEAEPDILFETGMHAREWLTAESAIALINKLYDSYYETDACDHLEVKELVENHEIWIIPMCNPDGRVKDDQHGGDPAQFYGSRGWRPNVQEFFCQTDGIYHTGIDLNRSFSYDFQTSGEYANCSQCGTNECESSKYNGGAPFTAKESRALANFINNHMFVLALSTHGPDQWIAAPSGTQGKGYYIAQEVLDIYSLGLPSSDMGIDLYTTNGCCGQFFGWLWQESNSGLDDGSRRTIQTVFIELPYTNYGCESDGKIGQYQCSDGSNKYHPSSGKLADWVIHKYVSIAKYLIMQSDWPFAPRDYLTMNPRGECPSSDLALVGAKISDVGTGLPGCLAQAIGGLDLLYADMRRITWNVQNNGTGSRDINAIVEINNETDGTSDSATLQAPGVAPYEVYTFTHDYDFEPGKFYTVEVMTGEGNSLNNDVRRFVFSTPIYTQMTLGDVDGNSTINIMDVLAVINHVLQVQELEDGELSRADCNGDGIVNIIDAINIVRVLLGEIPGCPGDGKCKPEVTPATMEFFETMATYLSAEDFTNVMDMVKAEAGMPTEYRLAQNYPNPFNPVTTIEYTLPEVTEVRVEIYNVLGQVVDVIVESKQEAGPHSVQWDASNLASGVYLYRLTAGDFTATKRMVLMK